MSLISIHNLGIAFGGPPVLDSISLDIFRGQRICLLGRNGAGKSTFMEILAGNLLPDRGEIIREPGVKVAFLPQCVPVAENGSVYEIVAGGLGEIGALLGSLFRAERDNRMAEAETLHHRLSDVDGWNLRVAVERVLSITMLDGSADFSTLSGGMRRRVLLARALVNEPDVLLLDEPTNHLDIESISWLESFILASNLTLLFVTHDRRLLRRLATRIIELDRGAMADWSCNYTVFLDRKQAQLDAEKREWERFDKKLAQEEVWIRRGIQARRTRNEGRVRALLRLREERRQRRERSGNVRMEISEAARSGSRVIEARDVHFGYGGAAVVQGFSVAIVRGDRIGIIGPNGCGKTTLLKLLLGTLPAQKGEVITGTNVHPVYFDQFRDVLDPEKTVWENAVPGGGDTVFVNGAPRHVISYLQDFLFIPERAKSPVKQLSGGERNRLLLARLFAVESNLLVLDEPTNDLDIETLELLEELVESYAGTVLVVSHDREFLNGTVTSIIAFEAAGVFREYVGGFDDWERQTADRRMAKTSVKTEASPKAKPAPSRGPKKRTYREEQEFVALPGQIEQLEHELTELTGKLGDAGNYRKEGFARDAKVRCASLEKEIAEAYCRWEELEGKGR